MATLSARAIRVRTSEGWQDIAIQGAMGPQGPAGLATAAAGGVLSGNYPNPGMAAGAASTNLGAAGGDLTGTYPNPLVKQRPQARVALAAAASHTSNGNWQRCPYNAGVFDTGAPSAQFDAANARLVCRVAGLYLVVARTGFAASATGLHRLTTIYKNGASYALGGVVASPGAGGPRTASTDLVQLLVGDYIENWPYQDSGGSLGYAVGATETSLSWAWLSS